MAAELGIVRSNAVPDLEVSHLGADGSDNADCLVARDQGELGDEFALVDML